MPYSIVKHGNTYAVKNIHTGQYKSKHTSLTKAKAQIRLLHMINNESAS
jgi:hypothetical protein